MRSRLHLRWLLGIVAGAGPALGWAQEGATLWYQGSEVSAERLLVKWKEGQAPDSASPQPRQAQPKKAATKSLPGVIQTKTFTTLPRLGVLHLEPEPEPARGARSTAAPAGPMREALLKQRIEALRATGQFEFVEPDFIVHAIRTPTDAAFVDGRLWGLRNTSLSGADVDATRAWDLTTGATNVIVAVIDTGIRSTHQDLRDNMWRNPREIAGNGLDDDNNGYVDDIHGINAINRTGNSTDDNNHGTHCAGTIGATANDAGAAVGVAWQVRLMALKFLAANGSGTTSDAITCIDYAVAHGAQILSNSWGGGGFSQALLEAIERAHRAGALFVAAAGNESNNNDTFPSYPASYPVANILAVAALDRSDRLASFSNYGRTSVHLGAPGVGIFSTTAGSDSSYASFNGTSMATPHVAGVAALIRARFPSISVADLRARILRTAVAIPALAGKTTTGGRVNAYRALTAEGDGILELAAVPESLPLLEAERMVFEVTVSDFEAVLGATVAGRLGANGPVVSFLDNGQTPDRTSQDGIYTASLTVPAANSTVRFFVNASAAGKSPAAAEFDFPVLRPPSNDNFASAISLSAGTTRTNGHSVGATSQPGEPRNPSVAGGSTVWWRWVAGSTALATITTSGSDFDTTLAVYQGSSLDGLSLVAANDDAGWGVLQSAVEFFSLTGQVYWIQADGFRGATGQIILNYPAPSGGGIPPTIVRQPDDQRLRVGQDLVLTVEATGSPSYQWYFDGRTISGATSSMYQRRSVSLEDRGSYFCRVANANGAVDSRQALVSVDPVSTTTPHDSFATPRLLTGFSGQAKDQNSQATGEPGEPDHGGKSVPLNSLWYQWSAPADGELVVNTEGSNFDTVLAVYQGEQLGSLLLLRADDDSGEGFTSRVVLEVRKDSAYRIVADGYGSRTGEIVLNYEFTASVQPVGNDAFANREVLNTLVASGDNLNFTAEPGEPDHAGRSAPVRSAWWTWTASASGSVTLDTRNSDFDTTLAVYQGSSLGGLTEVAANDDAIGTQSRVVFTASQGVTYQIAVAGWRGQQGNIRLNISSPSAPQGPPVVTSAGIASGKVGTAFRYTIMALGSPTSYNASGLPSGVSVNTSTGAISGTPTSAGTFTASISASNSGGTGSATLTISVAKGTPSITAAPTALTITHGQSLSSSILSGGSATVSGSFAFTTPSTTPSAGTSSHSVTFTPADTANYDTVTTTVSVTAVVRLSIGGDLTAATLRLNETYSYPITASGSPTSFGARDLPAGLKINAKTGVISGKPSRTGAFTVTLQAMKKGATTATATKVFTVVQVPTFTYKAIINAQRNKSVNVRPKVAGSPAPSFSVISGSLPPGLSLNASTAAITGTPTTAGTYPFTVRGSNSAGNTDRSTRIVVK